MVAISLYIVALPIFINLQFKDIEIYKKDYMNLIVGIFADTYIVAFFNMIVQLIIDYIYDSEKDRITLKKTAFSLKLKNVVVTIILIMAFTHYFNREFEGLFGDMEKNNGSYLYSFYDISTY